MDHEEEEDVDDPQQDSGSGHSTESEGVTDQSPSGCSSSAGSPKLDDEMGEVSQDNSNTDDNTDVDDGQEPQSEIRDGEFQFQVQSFHIVTVNARQGKKQYKCDVCTGTYQHAFSLKRHFLRTHVNYKYLSEADITNCNINLNLVRQLREESESLASGDSKFLGLYRCHLCSTLFDLRDELKAHVSSHVDDNGQKGFSCSQCEMTFSQRQHLVRHQSVHLAEKQFFCKHCDKSFPTLANQRRHEKIHEGSDLPFPCSFCAASFAHDVHLRKHLRNRHPECYYPCELCSKFFLEEGQLKKHRATHRAPVEGTPSKGCKPPDAHAFGRKRVKGLEPESKYLCSVCKHRFPTFISLRQHKKCAHGTVQQEKKTRSLQPRKEPISVRSRSAKPATKEMPEDQFYMTIAHRISENLLYHLDGTSTQLNIRRPDPCAFPEEKSERTNVQYSIDNFPAAFDITQMMQIYSNRVPSSNQGMSNDGSDNSEETEGIFLGGSQQDHTWPHKSNGVANFRSQNASENVIGHNIPVTFICSVCASKFSSRKAIDEHKINNHPNVVCTHVEIEGEKEVPPELCWTFTSPVGFLQSNTAVTRADSVPSQVNLVCTKCNSSFTSRIDLHQHILDCGTNSGFQKQLTRGYSVHSRLGCSARQLSVTSREGHVKGKKRPHLSESPLAEAKRAKAKVSSPRNQEQALDLKVHSEATPAKPVAEPVNEEQEEVVQPVEISEHTENTDDHVLVSQDTGDKHDTTALGMTVESAYTDEKMEELDTGVHLDAAIVQSPDNKQQSSPEELVGNATSSHTNEAPLAAEKMDDMPPSVPESSLKDVSLQPQEDSCEEVKAESDHFEFAEIEPAPSPSFGEGRRVLRSKTAAASNATGGASSALVNSHTCSTCKRSFTYLASLKKHLRDICPNKKVAGQKVVKRRKAGKFSKKEGTSSETRICTEPVQDSTEVKKEHSETASSCLSSSVTFPEEADTSGLELLANASSMAAPNCSGGASWSPSSSSLNQPASTVQTKEVESKVLAAPARRLRGKERTDDEDVDRKPDTRPHSQEHTCPYCLHSFAYLSNFRKHLKEVCLLKDKARENGCGSEPPLFSAKTSDESRSLVDRADDPSTVTMSFKGRIENSVINLLRNQSKQVELIGAQAAAVKDQPGGANHSSPNFMTFSCPVCHKIFLSYVKMLQHRLLHKLQTDEPLVKEEKTDVPEAADAHDGETSADDAGQVSEGVRRADCSRSPASASTVKTDEDQRFDEILTGVRGSDGVLSEALQEELKREEHNYAVSLAELDSLPDEDDGEDVVEAEATKEPPVEEVAPSEAIAETTRAAKKTGAGKKSPVTGSKAPAKDKVRRGMRRQSSRASKTMCRDKQ
uniref:Putative zinc finger protein 53 n=1 Tax=Rhipicephalus pulchellus TaxID=72859 RepID=L7M4W3_RHIPC